MFQFPGLPFLAEYPNFIRMGSPIRTSTDRNSFAVPRSFSQLTTSFVVSRSLGIPRTPLFASYPLSLFLSYPILFSPVVSMNFLANIPQIRQLPDRNPPSENINPLSCVSPTPSRTAFGTSNPLLYSSNFVEDKGVEPLTSRMQI